ncbi:spermidine synthase [Comamonas sp. E6]|uniref:spermidine synthase n=1 Tax=Comamonas sp. E6 TaxID=364029 RepID=UPI000638E17D|nr:hypothetical protein [Comamonas sp. E6]GAO69625.1 spermine synthase [Comamonas sp. E6]
MNAARFISFWTGFCSLSLEIAWVRLYGYANQSTPQAFAYVLAIYLLGIALGAQIGKRVCQLPLRQDIEKVSVLVLLVGSVVAVMAPWVFLGSRDLALDDIVAPLGILLTAATLSVLFPITHHLGTPQQSAGSVMGKGRHFSRVYIMNVVGAALGPLVTGYVLLEFLTITQTFAFLAAVIFLLACAAGWVYGLGHKLLVQSCMLLCLGLTLVGGYWAWSDAHSFARSWAIAPGQSLVAVHENRHGIITITESQNVRRQGFVDYLVYGGNVYDGKVNVDLERNTNGLERPLALHVLQPEAKRVLILGLSIGSWLTVVRGFPGVEQIEVVEINPGYMTLARQFEAQRRALEDPRVRIHIDDARRWLQYYPQEKYDLILMNTTWHWRANSSMLLSQEMMALVSRHLTDKGVLAFNATGSVDAFYTASTVFKETRRYQNFIYGAQWDPFTQAQSLQSWERLYQVTVDGKPGFRKGGDFVEKYAKVPFLKVEHDLQALGRVPEVIRDDNMLVEYKYGKK